MVLRRRDAEIFMNGKKWRMRRVSVRERGVRGRGGRVFFFFFSPPTRAMSGLIYIKSGFIWLRCHSGFILICWFI